MTIQDLGNNVLSFDWKYVVLPSN